MRRAGRRGTPPEPLSQYGTSKLAGEEYLATYNRLYGSEHTALRYGNVFGPRQDPHGEAGVVAIFLGLLARGEAPHIFGDGTQQRDYVYVGDVAAATVAALERPAGVFNVGTGVATSVLDLFEACRRASGVDVEPVFDPPRLGELQRSVLDTGLAERELGFRAATSFDDGIAATWEFIRSAEGERGPRGELDRPVEHRADLPATPPWRSAAFIAATVATVELVILLIVGIWLFGKFFSDEVTKATDPTTVARAAVERQLEAGERSRSRQRRHRAPSRLLPRAETSVLVLNGNGVSGAAERPRARYARRTT